MPRATGTDGPATLAGRTPHPITKKGLSMSGAPSRRPRTARLRAAVLATSLVAGLGVSLVGAPTASAQTADPVLQPGQTASSNMNLLANLPKRGAFAPESAFNSDLAFKDDYAFAGNYEGFTVYNIKQPRNPREVVQLVCPGSQNDISVHGNLLFLSVDSLRSDDTCNSTSLSVAQASATGTGYWEGIRIFDISNPAAPKYIKAVETDCGSHTHTLIPGKDGRDVFLYVSSYNPNAALADCQPPHDKISVVKVPLSAPTTASVVAEPVLFPDGGQAGNPAPATVVGAARLDPQYTSATAGCHDITAFPSKNIAAGACMGEGVIMDISNVEAPKVVETVTDENFAFWHSATFNNAANKVMFTDELGGGGAAVCNPSFGPTRGADGIYTMDNDKQLTFQSYFKIPRTQSDTENCVAHNGSLIPVKGSDIMVQAWYQGGISVFDFTDAKNPKELGYFDRGPLATDRLILGGSWSAYYYKGFVYSNDIQKGLDVLEITSQSVRGKTINTGKKDKFGKTFNPQTQPVF